MLPARQAPSHQRHSSSSASSSPSPTTTAARPAASRFPPPSWPRNSSDSITSTTTGGGGGGGGIRLSSASPRAAPVTSRAFWRSTSAALLRRASAARAAFQQLPPRQRLAAAALALLALALVLLTLLYTEAFFAWLATVSGTWRRLPGGWLIAFLLVSATAFPPLVGYSTACTVAGFVFGFPGGWPVAAAACVLGSLAAFVACRTVLSGRVHGLVGGDHRFVALGQVLRRDGLLYLTAIRFCPLPFSLSNGFLATIPSISPLAFALSTALSTPKLLIHIFIGSRLALLAEQGDSMSLRDKIVNYTGVAIGAAVGAAAGIIIYRRTMARAAELALEENNNTAAAEEGAAGYEDADAADAALLGPEDAAEVMGEDDISLWDAQAGDWDYDDDGNSPSNGHNDYTK